jgi:hypothetical protein
MIKLEMYPNHVLFAIAEYNHEKGTNDQKLFDKIAAIFADRGFILTEDIQLKQECPKCTAAENPGTLVENKGICALCADEAATDVNTNQLNLKDLIKQKRREVTHKRAQERAERLQERVAKLKPMYEQLKEGLEDVPVDVILHTNEKHCPCPAIHIKTNGNHMRLRDAIGEIYLTESTDSRWRSGSCNAHRYKHTTDEDLLQFVAKSIAELL